MILQREVARRDFIKLSAGSTAALGLLLFGFPNFEKVFAASVAEVPVIWLQGGGCTGCSVSVLNSLSPKIQDILVNQVIPGKHVSLRFHPTVMAASGDLAMKAIEDTAKKKGGYVLVVEGAISEKDFELLRVFDSPEDVTKAVVTWYTRQEFTGRKAL